MTQLLTVSRELFKRQGDNRFADLPSLLAAARSRQLNGKELNSVNPARMLFATDESAPGGITLDVLNTKDTGVQPLHLTNYSLGQLSTITGAPSSLIPSRSVRHCAIMRVVRAVALEVL